MSAQPEQSAVHPETVAVMYEALQQLVLKQAADWSSMDAKAFQVLTAGGVVLGVASIGGAGWAPWFVLAAAAFILVSAGSLAAVWPRTFRNPFDARRLFDEHWMEPPEDLRYAMVYTAARQAAPANSAALRRKSAFVTAACACFAAEAVFIALWAVSAL